MRPSDAESSSIPTRALSADAAAVLDRATGVFRATFGPPRHAAVAPGRVNLIGEHIDYNDGYVLPVAIDRWCAAVGAPAKDPTRRRVIAVELGEEAVLPHLPEGGAGGGPVPPARSVGSRSRLPAPDSIPTLPSTHTTEARGAVVPPGSPRSSSSQPSWLPYVRGVIELFERRFPSTPPLDLVIASSVPLGSGLSSSASLEVAVATLLQAAAHIDFDPREKALLCQRAEHEYAGVPCGLMDQFISAMGRAGHALLIDCVSHSAVEVPMPPTERAVLAVINTNVRHALAGGEYAERRASCAAALSVIRGAAGLAPSAGWRAVTPEHLTREGGVLTEPQRRAAQHVVTEIARTREAADALRAADLPRFGSLMNESHESLRHDFRVSCTELDAAVEIARSVRGVFGARLTGGGFGGCAIAMVEPGAVGELVGTLAREYPRRAGRGASVLITPAMDGARVVSGEWSG